MLFLLLPHQQDTLVDEHVLLLHTQSTVISLDLDPNLVLDKVPVLDLDLVLALYSDLILGSNAEPWPRPGLNPD